MISSNGNDAVLRGGRCKILKRLNLQLTYPQYQISIHDGSGYPSPLLFRISATTFTREFLIDRIRGLLLQIGADRTGFSYHSFRKSPQLQLRQIGSHGRKSNSLEKSKLQFQQLLYHNTVTLPVECLRSRYLSDSPTSSIYVSEIEDVNNCYISEPMQRWLWIIYSNSVCRLSSQSTSTNLCQVHETFQKISLKHHQGNWSSHTMRLLCWALYSTMNI